MTTIPDYALSLDEIDEVLTTEEEEEEDELSDDEIAEFIRREGGEELIETEEWSDDEPDVFEPCWLHCCVGIGTDPETGVWAVWEDSFSETEKDGRSKIYDEHTEYLYVGRSEADAREIFEARRPYDLEEDEEEEVEEVEQ